MWPLLIGSTILAVVAFAVGSKRKTPSVPADVSLPDDDDDDDDTDDDSSEGEPTPDDAAEPHDPNEYDDADVYYDVDANKKAARRARVPKVKE